MNRRLRLAGLGSALPEQDPTIDDRGGLGRFPRATTRRRYGAWKKAMHDFFRGLPAALAWLAAAVASAQVVLPPNVGVPPRAETAPPAGHDLALAALATGDHAAALELANACYRGASRIGAERWIDSIAAAALVGECLFERGDFRGAVAAYEEAMLLQAGPIGCQGTSLSTRHGGAARK